MELKEVVINKCNVMTEEEYMLIEHVIYDALEDMRDEQRYDVLNNALQKLSILYHCSAR